MNDIFPIVDKSDLDEFYKIIGQNVRSIRQEKKVSQLELALSIGHRGTAFLSNCENYKNKEHFNLEHLFLIAGVLKVDIKEFI
jgi:transcriptional regulator with XRE-family HTH domain